MGLGGLFALLVLIGDVWAMISVLQSPAPGAHKALWILLIFILPLIGLIIWFFAGPRKAGP